MEYLDLEYEHLSFSEVGRSKEDLISGELDKD